MPLRRSSGLLLHISSLPSLGGIGDLGPAAYDFANFLHEAGQRVWQVLPINPTGYGNSPYSALSAMAGNPFFISLEVLRDWGWISPERLESAGLPGAQGSVDFEPVFQVKLPLIVDAARHFLARHTPEQWARFETFCREKAHWLDDYAVFIVLRQLHHNVLWTEWPKPLAHREPAALAHIRAQHDESIQIEKAIQFAFDEQWNYLHAYCRERDIELMGDVAIFVSYDSADVWTHPEIFELDQHRSPIHVAGVPPDYFSATGQRWGNPLYDWKHLERHGFTWWIERMRRANELYDLTRLDHFRGFEAFWSIPGEDDTAVNGRWVKAPGHALFSKLREALGELPFIAEDLGVITEEVDELRNAFAMPGMRILQFGFGDRGAHNYLPHRYEPNAVVYTGTHDNDTTLGWWHNGAQPHEKEAVLTYCNPGADGVVWALIRAASTSVANLCLFPVQDVLEIGSEGRMNVPSAASGNWSWRMDQSGLTSALAKKLYDLSDLTDRTTNAEQQIAETKRRAEEEKQQ